MHAKWMKPCHFACCTALPRLEPSHDSLTRLLLSYPVAVFRDVEKSRSRVEFSNGTDTLISVGGITYEVVPRIDKMQCLVTEGEANGGDSNALPDLADYEYAGKTEYKGIPAYKWVYKTTCVCLGGVGVAILDRLQAQHALWMLRRQHVHAGFFPVIRRRPFLLPAAT